MENLDFLPVSREDMRERDWYWYDFLLVTGDAYVDHPSFGPAVISRVLEKEGYRVAVLAQPDWKTADDFLAMGKPKYGVMISAGNLDSMVAHYTAAKKHRSEDFYSPGKVAGLRPDRATIVYANRVREAFGKDVPIIIGGLEASLRRFAHYDYWENKVRRSILFDASADLLVYGMGEKAIVEIARRLKSSENAASMTDIPGTAFLTARQPSGENMRMCDSYEGVSSAANKKAYAQATMIQYDEHDPVSGHAIVQAHDDRFLVVLPPAMPLSQKELDEVASLPFTRESHPMYEVHGGVPALEEVRFSIIHNRGCFGACNFCSLAWHQGRMVTSRSHESVLREAEQMTHHKDFKGYISDVGGPTANFRHLSCKQQMKRGMCRNRKCLTPSPCDKLDPDHSDYLALLRRLRKMPGIKKVFIRSGIRYDYLLAEKDKSFLEELVIHHVSGQLKVAPEHCVDSVLDFMGKPHFEVYHQFIEAYNRVNEQNDKRQFVVPYLMSSHPGSTLTDAVALAEYLHKSGRQPEQVQDFYPTPGTLSTCMYYTGFDPRTLLRVYVARTPHEKDLQRALLQWRNPDNRSLVVEALHKAHREDLIGHDPKCLIRPESKAARAVSEAAKKGPVYKRNGAKNPVIGPLAKRKSTDKSAGTTPTKYAKTAGKKSQNESASRTSSTKKTEGSRENMSFAHPKKRDKKTEKKRY